MRNVVWLLQGNMNNQTALHGMRKELKDCGYANICIDLEPFADEIPAVGDLNGSELVICWGPSFVPRTNHYPELQPGIWFESDTFTWECFQNNWKDCMLSQDAEILPLNVALSLLSDRRVFMRPNEDSKLFDGGVYEKNNPPLIKRDAKNEEKVVIAEPRHIESEWRFFVIGKQVIAESSYRISSSATITGFVPPEARSFAEEAAHIWGPADVYCLDIGYDGSAFGIVEANCFNASRTYGANIGDIVKSVSEYSIERYNS